MSDNGVKYHINPETGRPNQCTATVKSCKYAQDGEIPEHYDTKEEARAAYEKQNENQTVKTVNKKDKNVEETVESPEEKKIIYSFSKRINRRFEEIEEECKDLPSRFFNADIRNGIVSTRLDLDEALATPEGERIKIDPNGRGYYGAYQAQKINARMIQAVSAPKDLAMSEEEVRQACEELGITDVQDITGNPKVYGFTSHHAYVGRLSNGKQIIIGDKAMNSKNFATFYFRRNTDPTFDGRFSVVDARALAGAKRVQDKTGVNLLETNLDLDRKADYTDQEAYSKEQAERFLKSVKALSKLEELQNKGNNLRRQKKYISDSTKQVATAWMDKKNIDQAHKDMANNSVLNGHFRKIELDNEVDASSFSDFENQFMESRKKLPKVPKGLEPELRVRLLGKHRATGVFFPHKNTVCVDVHTSGSTIHELGHQYDLLVKDNASMSKDFESISRDYSSMINIPAGTSPGKMDYYSTPTEIFARGMEHWAHERLGIQNRLIDESKFDNFDHEPFKNPELRERTFKFFDNLFKDDLPTS